MGFCLSQPKFVPGQIPGINSIRATTSLCCGASFFRYIYIYGGWAFYLFGIRDNMSMLTLRMMGFQKGPKKGVLESESDKFDILNLAHSKNGVFNDFSWKRLEIGTWNHLLANYNWICFFHSVYCVFEPCITFRSRDILF